MSYDAALGINTPFLNQLLDEITKVIFHPEENEATEAASMANGSADTAESDDDAEESTGEKMKKLLAEYMPPVVALESPNLVAYFAKGGNPTVPSSESWPDSGIFCCIDPGTLENVMNILGGFPSEDEESKSIGPGFFKVVATGKVTINGIKGVKVESSGALSATLDGSVGGSLKIENPIHDVTIPLGISGDISAEFKPTIDDNKLYLEVESVHVDPHVDLPGWVKEIEEKIMDLISSVLTGIIKLLLNRINPVKDFSTITIDGDLGVNIDKLETAAKDSNLLANAEISVVEKSVAA